MNTEIQIDLDEQPIRVAGVEVGMFAGCLFVDGDDPAGPVVTAIYLSGRRCNTVATEIGSIKHYYDDVTLALTRYDTDPDKAWLFAKISSEFENSTSVAEKLQEAKEEK